MVHVLRGAHKKAKVGAAGKLVEPYHSHLSAYTQGAAANDLNR